MSLLMATGYVHTMIDKDQTFEQFAMSCARAFGALITMRDDANDAPIPDVIEPSDYHAKAALAAVVSLDNLNSMDEPARLAFGETEKKRIIDELLESKRKTDSAVEKCRLMLGKVSDWTPPTDEHEELKLFMRNQIWDSIKDESATYDEQIEKYRQMPSPAFFDESLKAAQSNVQYHKTEDEKEIARAAGRTQWLRDLRGSLGK